MRFILFGAVFGAGVSIQGQIRGLGTDQEFVSSPEDVQIQSPVLTLLPDGERQAPFVNPPTLRWPIHIGPGPFTVVIGRSADLKDGQVQAPVKETFFRPFSALDAGEWFWKVVSADGSESPTASFYLPEDLPVWEIPDWDSLLANIPRGHPRVYMRPEELPRLRELANGPYREVFDARVKRFRRQVVGAEIPSLPENTDSKWFGRIEREYVNGPVRRLTELAYMYQITQDVRFADEIRRRTLHFLQYTPEELAHPDRNDFANSWMIASFASAYDAIDWLPEEKQRIAEAILERIKLGMDKYMPGRIHDQQQINSGAHAWQWTVRNMTLGALALYHDYPEAREYFEWSLKIHVALYPWFGGADGGSAEGARYYQGTGIHTALETAQLFYTATGLNFFNHPWFKNTIWHLMYTQGLGDAVSQFGDGRGLSRITDKGYASARIYAGKTGNPYFKAYYDELARLYGDEFKEDNGLFWVGMFLEPLEFAEPAPGLLAELPQARWFRDIGLVTMRSDFMNPEQDIFFEFRSSPYGSVDHNHADQNSFNINAYGDPIVLDSGYYDSYNSPHHAGWTTLSMAHNTVLVHHTGQPRRSWEAFGTITAFETGDGFVRTSGSCSKAYKETAVEQFDRHVLWLKPDTYLIVDNIKAEEPSTYQWLLHSPNEMQIDPVQNTLMLGTEKAEARVRFFAPDQLSFSQTDQFPVGPQEGNPHQRGSQTPPQWHLTASTETPSREQQFVTVIQVCPAGQSGFLPVPSVTVQDYKVGLILSDGRAGEISWESSNKGKK